MNERTIVHLTAPYQAPRHSKEEETQAYRIPDVPRTVSHVAYRNGAHKHSLSMRGPVLFKVCCAGLVIALLSCACGISSGDKLLDSAVSDLSTKTAVLESALANRLTEINASTGPILSAGVGAAKAGQIVTIPLTLIPSKFKTSAIQTDVLFPGGVSLVSFSTGSVLTGAGKSISAAPVPGGYRFLIFGINQTTIGEALLTNLRLRVDSSVKANNYPVLLTGFSASDPNGNGQILSTMSGTVVVK